MKKYIGLKDYSVLWESIVKKNVIYARFDDEQLRLEDDVSFSDTNVDYLIREGILKEYNEQESQSKDDEKMDKFKVGDFVKLTKGYHFFDKGCLLRVIKKDKYMEDGKKMYFCSNLKNTDRFFVFENDMKLISSNNDRSIHITFKGNDTYAILKDGKDVVNKVKVGLYHGDEYDMNIGVQEAINKLLNINEENIGMLDNLTTTNKTNFVDAINKRVTNRIKEVNRRAINGEYVRIVDYGHNIVIPTTNGIPDYKVGDILKVIVNEDCWAFYSTNKDADNGKNRVLNQEEYVVLENYIPSGIEKDFSKIEINEVSRVAEVGEYVKIIKADDLSTPKTNGLKDYRVGDILKIIPNNQMDWIFSKNARRYGKCARGEDSSLTKILYENEYVVLEGYKEV